MIKKHIYHIAEEDEFIRPIYRTTLSKQGIYQAFFINQNCFSINSVIKMLMVKTNLGIKPVIFHYNIGEQILQPGQSKVYSQVWQIPYDYEPGWYKIKGYDDAEELRNNKFYIPIRIV